MKKSILFAMCAFPSLLYAGWDETLQEQPPQAHLLQKCFDGLRETETQRQHVQQLTDDSAREDLLNSIQEKRQLWSKRFKTLRSFGDRLLTAEDYENLKDAVIKRQVQATEDAAEEATPLSSPSPTISEPEDIWQEHKRRTLAILREEQKSQLKGQNPPKIKSGLLGKTANATGWKAALENLDWAINKEAEIGTFPPEERWPLRGTVKAYNLHLLSELNKLEERQKAAFLASLRK